MVTLVNAMQLRKASSAICGMELEMLTLANKLQSEKAPHPI